jgi:F0F1-type ATP synthase delta subunit
MTLSRDIANLILHKNLQVEDAVEILRKYDLLALLPSIQESLAQMTKVQGEEHSIYVETPFPIEEKTIGKIQKMIGSSVAPVRVVINKNILAGFKARYRGKLYDGSAERIIKEFTNH